MDSQKFVTRDEVNECDFDKNSRFKWKWYWLEQKDDWCFFSDYYRKGNKDGMWCCDVCKSKRV